jgi:hypothetical protein
MVFLLHLGLLSLPLLQTVEAIALRSGASVNKTLCNGKTYTYEELAGWGLFASDARDKFGDTIGGIGSAIALDKSSWKRTKGDSEAYEGILYGLPDRGWNTQGNVLLYLGHENCSTNQ